MNPHLLCIYMIILGNKYVAIEGAVYIDLLLYKEGRLRDFLDSCNGYTQNVYEYSLALFSDTNK